MHEEGGLQLTGVCEVDSLFSLSSHGRFLLRQEQEKHQSALMLYNKTREQLQRKEEQQRAEAEERHKAELNVRSLELEIRALKNSIKQVNCSRLLGLAGKTSP